MPLLLPFAEVHGNSCSPFYLLSGSPFSSSSRMVHKMKAHPTSPMEKGLSSFFPHLASWLLGQLETRCFFSLTQRARRVVLHKCMLPVMKRKTEEKKKKNTTEWKPGKTEREKRRERESKGEKKKCRQWSQGLLCAKQLPCLWSYVLITLMHQCNCLTQLSTCLGHVQVYKYIKCFLLQ